MAEGAEPKPALTLEKAIKGLVYKNNESRKVKEDGREVVKTSPVSRPLKVSDVKAYKWYVDHPQGHGRCMVIVAKDGQKHVVKAD